MLFNCSLVSQKSIIVIPKYCGTTVKSVFSSILVYLMEPGMPVWHPIPMYLLPRILGHSWLSEIGIRP